MSRKRTSSAPFKLRSGNQAPFRAMGSSPVRDMKTGSYSHSFEDNNSPIQRGPHMMGSPLHKPWKKWKTLKKIWDKGVDLFRGGGGKKRKGDLTIDKRKKTETIQGEAFDAGYDAARPAGWKTALKWLPPTYIAVDMVKRGIDGIISKDLPEVEVKGGKGGGKDPEEYKRILNNIVTESGDTIKSNYPSRVIPKEKKKK